MIEPKFSVDATLRQVTLDKSMANLPPALQSLNLFQLEGDLVDANRGIVEYSDFLKRPVESFKYLLNTCESSTVNLGNVVVTLDTLFLGTTNDRQLDAFREHPEFYSFKSRLELVRVPYLLRYSEEEKIYEGTAKDVRGTKELMPHTCRTLAMWAVLTRLKKPLTKNKPAALIRILESLTPLEKAKIYDHGELPDSLGDEDRRELRTHVEDLVVEHAHHIYYEGLLGASARELKVVLQTAAQDSNFKTLGPEAVLAQLRKLVKRVGDFDYLRQEAVPGGYHDFAAFIEVVQEEWLNWIDSEMRAAIELHSTIQIDEAFSDYIKQVSVFVKGEKVKNRHTGKNEIPDDSNLKDLEKVFEIKGSHEDHRMNLISKLGAWSIEHKGIPRSEIPYSEVFPQLVEKMVKHYHEKETHKVKEMGQVLLDSQNFEDLDKKDPSSMSSGETLALRAYKGLQEKFGYGPDGAIEALTQLIRKRYR